MYNQDCATCRYRATTPRHIRLCDWYLEKIDYGRNPQPRVMETLYVLANRIVQRWRASHS